MLRQLLIASALLFLASPAQAQTVAFRADRLARLADHLEQKVDPSRFDMGVWSNTDNPDDPNYLGCAAGHSTSLFARDGLKIRDREIRYGNETNGPALIAFFGLTPMEECYLFGNPEYYAQNDPKRAAWRIRRVIAKHVPVTELVAMAAR